jgi:hypothetical protein
MKPVVESLRSTDEAARSRGLDELRALGESLTPSEGQYALRAAGEGFPLGTHEGPEAPDVPDVEGELVTAASSNPHVSYVPIVREDFAGYSPRAQGAALRLLGSIEEREGAEALVEVLDQVSEDAEVTTLGTMADRPRHADVLFPEVLSYVGHPQLQWAVLKVVLAHLSQGHELAPSNRVAISRTLVDMHRELRTKLAPRQRRDGFGWIWEDDYLELRDVAAIVLDALGRTGTPEAKSELFQALDYDDPRLQLFSVLGLLRLGEEPSRESLLAVAGSSESRNWLHRGLVEVGRRELFPEALATQEAFAESEMVNWLIYPTELGRVPDEIELMAIVPDGASPPVGDFYVFRFRTFAPHWAAEDGWMAGVAGPFVLEESPSEAYGGTFSTFTPWDEKSPEEHVRAIQDLLEESRMIRSSDPR